MNVSAIQYSSIGKASVDLLGRDEFTDHWHKGYFS